MLAIVGLAIAMAANVLVVFVARFGVARLVGLRGIRFLPKRGLGPPVAASKQAICLVACVVAAYAFPGCLFAGALLSGGRVAIRAPEDRGTRVNVIPGKAADVAGVRNGDRFVSIAGEPVERWDELAAAIQRRPNETIAVVVEREGENVTLEVAVPSEGRIGVQLAEERVPVGPVEALISGMKAPAIAVYAFVTGLTRWLFGQVEAEVGGPVMIVRESARAAEPSLADGLYRVAALDSLYGLPLAFLMAFAIRVRRQPGM